MFDDQHICPYPGLRSFNEDESIYFKGRDGHVDEIVALLQKNRFLMVTGASGDGKSSLIFAGLVPNARAGFFKAAYSNWAVAHFRPERTPIKNFAHALSGIMTEFTDSTIQTEINRGFSSIIDLYQNSSLYFDEHSNVYKESNEDERKSIQRKSSNLLIIVDQFEEFFTNTENFRDGAPSQPAQRLINGLLETSRIALEQDIPVYVVFTMRSDYIGQCSAFRGLPEYIGFSQFFVPRLKRMDLQQVIEEPATLNGDEISRRLVERLLFDMSEGVDQLPILQHALSQIWSKASEKNEKLDLLHYAMVGAMPSEELPEEDQPKFQAWFNDLPEWKKELFVSPGLRQVLDIHANELYENAWEVYSSTYPESPISIADARRIIGLSFACLTKIDDSRAVRNLMSIDEITRIINIPHISAVVVDRVLSSFRKQGNTFIRPFVDENDADTVALTADTVLDITHESLIRNWGRLSVWANKEFEYFETFVDFKKQLSKWLESGKSSGYLLPIGPLTYFETWYEECRPNIAWISRYTSSSEASSAEEILDQTKLFLSKSKKKVAITRAFMKYGTARLASLAAILFVVSISVFYYMDAKKKQNQSVLVSIQEESIALLNDPSIGFAKGDYLSSLERVAGNAIQTLNKIDSLPVRLDAAIETHRSIFDIDPKFKAPFKDDLQYYIGEQLHDPQLSDADKLSQLVHFTYSLAYDDYLNQGIAQKLLARYSAELPELLISQDDENIDKNDNYHAFNLVLNHGNSLADIDGLVVAFSPFNQASKEKFDRRFPSASRVDNGRFGGISHNAGYQIMGGLYAAQGNLDRVQQCLDTLLDNNSNYARRDNYNNGSNIIGYLMQYGYVDEARMLIPWLASKIGLSESALFKDLMDRSGFMKYAYNYMWYQIPAYNYGLSLLDQEHVAALFEWYEEAILHDYEGDALNYELAKLYKQRGIYISKWSGDHGVKPNVEEINRWYEKAVKAYSLISEDFLNEFIRVEYRYYVDGFRSTFKPRKYFFLYPDHFDNGWYNDRFISTTYASFILSSTYMKDLYKTSDDLEAVNDWTSSYYALYNITNAPNARRNLPQFDFTVLRNLHELVGNTSAYERFNSTLINLLLANMYFEEGNLEMGKWHFDEIAINEVQPIISRWEYLSYTSIQNQVLSLSKHLALNQYEKESKFLLETLRNDNDRSVSYAELAKTIFDTKNKQAGFVFLDSAISKGKKVDLTLIPFQFSFRYYLINTLASVGGRAMNEMADDVAKKVPIRVKDRAAGYHVSGVAFEGSYYRAWKLIPDVGPKQQKLYLYMQIFAEESAKNPSRAGWEEFDKELERVTKQYIIYDDNY